MKKTLIDIMRRMAAVLAIAAVLISLLGNSAWAAKNVILMIADGSGHNTWAAASMSQGKLGKQVYDQPGWLRLSCSTYPLNLSNKPTGGDKQDPSLIYDPIKAWDSTPLPQEKNEKSLFAGYKYLTETPTDSAAAATAMSTGCKTFNNAINWSNEDKPIQGTIAQLAKAEGKSVGVVTSVQWSHATPAGLGGAHNASRDQYAEIANEMLEGNWLDVIMGAGNPDFDDDGRAIIDGTKREFKYVGGEETWKVLKRVERGWARMEKWKLIESKADFEALTSGPTPPKVLGVAQVATTFQEKRSRDPVVLQGQKKDRIEPFTISAIDNVPSLATVAKAAINCLDDNPKGFFLMIEGGAVDWANHANEPERMIEEQIGFVEAVEAVVAWIESHGGWDETLLILTADHECGLVWGPNSAKVAFDSDFGVNNEHYTKYNSTGHSNSLVPVYARGLGSRRLTESVKGKDAKAAAVWQYSGEYIDNTDIFRAMKTEMQGNTKQ